MKAEAQDADESLRARIDAILAERPLRAGAFIVTLYGDVIVPRGGVVWIGNIIETCAEVGINESLVRTAVSRLVAAGRLEGARDGRRSFYRLTEAALAEFEAAAAVLYAGEATECGEWQFVHLGADHAGAWDALERAGFARIAPRLAIAPWGRRAPAGLVFRAAAVPGTGAALRAFAAEHWRLALHAAAYRDFLRLFQPLAARIEAGPPPTGRSCLIARLVLVDEFRRAALADPRLPEAALPREWPGAAARRLFAELYLRLSGPADSHVAERFVALHGALRVDGDALLGREAALSGR